MSDSPFEPMIEGDDGWTDWVHPLPGYRMKCCDCGLVHDMEFQIARANSEEADFNPGEDRHGVVILRARRAIARTDEELAAFHEEVEKFNA